MITGVREISRQDLERFRRRTALTNKRAGYHYLALVKAERGMDPIQTSNRATPEERYRGIGGQWDVRMAFTLGRFFAGEWVRLTAGARRYQFSQMSPTERAKVLSFEAGARSFGRSA